MLPDFTGRWRVNRRIMGENARLIGTVEFLPVMGDLLYRENGTLRTPHAQTDAYRQYIYRREGAVLHILYDDYRPFLMLRFKDGMAHDVHQCGPDEYRAACKIKSDNEFLIGFAVKGPRKDYFTVSRMTRV